jgi:hypothetical protein
MTSTDGLLVANVIILLFLIALIVVTRGTGGKSQ